MKGEPIVITPELLLIAYSNGAFPMGRSRDDEELVWLSPDPRGVFPLNGLKISKSLRKTLRSGKFSITADTAFSAVLDACAAPQPDREDREDTWITPQIVDLYTRLHKRGNAHSIECWHDGKLVGGLYGVHYGAAFFGESMFSTMNDASKVALVYLVARMRAGGFLLLDTQFTTPHLESLGAIEIPRDMYMQYLDKALSFPGDFMPPTEKIATELEHLCKR